MILPKVYHTHIGFSIAVHASEAAICSRFHRDSITLVLNLSPSWVKSISPSYFDTILRTTFSPIP
jgi:hypothetical protein